MPRPSSGSEAVGASAASGTATPGARWTAATDPSGSSTGSIPATASTMVPSGRHERDVPSITDPSSSQARAPARCDGGATNDTARTDSKAIVRFARSSPLPCSSSIPASVIADTMPVASSPLRRKTRSSSVAAGGSPPSSTRARKPSTVRGIGPRHDVDHAGDPDPASSSPTIRWPSAMMSTPARRGRIRPGTSIIAASAMSLGKVPDGSTRTSPPGPKATHDGATTSSRGAGALRTLGTVSSSGGLACACATPVAANETASAATACRDVGLAGCMPYFWKIGR